MKMIKQVVVSMALVGAGAMLAYPVYAHCGKCAADGKKIVAQLDQNKMTLAKAVTSAEQHSKGRAISVISELNDSDKLALEVYCISGEKIMRCNVDGTAGSVIDMKEVKEFPITEDDHAHPHPAPGGGMGGEKPSAMNITNQVVEVACGSCVYKMTGVEGCDIAVKIDGKQYLVTGANVDAHQFCAASKQALVSGRIEGNKFIATKFEVKT